MSVHDEIVLPIVFRSASDLGQSGISRSSFFAAALAAMATRLPACFSLTESVVELAFTCVSCVGPCAQKHWSETDGERQHAASGDFFPAANHV